MGWFPYVKCLPEIHDVIFQQSSNWFQKMRCSLQSVNLIQGPQ
jgi:hypothetical protein